MRQLPKGISNYEDIVRENRIYVDKTMYCTQISDLISAFIIYLCGFVFFFKLWLNRYLDKRDEKKAAKQVKGGEK